MKLRVDFKLVIPNKADNSILAALGLSWNLTKLFSAVSIDTTGQHFLLWISNMFFKYIGLQQR